MWSSTPPTHNAFILFSRAMPPRYGQSRCCKSGVIRRRRSLVLKTTCRWHDANECIFFRPYGTSIVFDRLFPPLKRWAIFKRPCGTHGLRSRRSCFGCATRVKQPQFNLEIFHLDDIARTRRPVRPISPAIELAFLRKEQSFAPMLVVGKSFSTACSSGHKGPCPR